MIHFAPISVATEAESALALRELRAQAEAFNGAVEDLLKLVGSEACAAPAIAKTKLIPASLVRKSASLALAHHV